MSRLSKYWKVAPGKKPKPVDEPKLSGPRMRERFKVDELKDYLANFFKAYGKGPNRHSRRAYDAMERQHDRREARRLRREGKRKWKADQKAHMNEIIEKQRRAAA